MRCAPLKERVMNNTKESGPIVSPTVEPGTYRWDGHMSDDVGATFGVQPMAYLSATRDEIVISGSRGTHRVPRTAITKISRGKMYPWFFAGIRVRHTLSAVPAELQFKPMGVHWRDVLRALRELGFPAT